MVFLKTHYKFSDYEQTMRELLKQGGEFRIYPKGNSMQPLIRQGEDSVLLMFPQKDLQKNDIILYQRENGQFVLHRIYCVDNENYVLWGDHQLALEYGIAYRQIMAKVKYIYRKNKMVDKNSLLYRLYLFIWCRSLIIRKVLYKIVKVLIRLFSKERYEGFEH